MPVHKLYENAGATATQRRRCYKGVRKRNHKKTARARGGRRRWEDTSARDARLETTNLSQGKKHIYGNLPGICRIKQVCDVRVPSAYIRPPERCHLKLRERQEERWWLARHGPQEEAAGGRHGPAPALRNLQRLPRRRAPPVRGPWKTADPFSLNSGVIHRLCCWETSVKARGRRSGGWECKSYNAPPATQKARLLTATQSDFMAQPTLALDKPHTARGRSEAGGFPGEKAGGGGGCYTQTPQGF